jgi:hypothetical protein
LVRRVERLTTGRVSPENTPGRGVRLAAVAALLGLIMFAPRAAIGSDLAAGRFFNARVPGAQGIVMFRRLGPPALDGQKGKQVEAVMVRVRGH